MASCGGMLAACRTAMREGVSGSLSAGFHHAGAERGQMHCIFNGLAMAVAQLHKSGVQRVLHVDVDAHCGGGTFSLVGQLSGYHQLDVSLFSTTVTDLVSVPFMSVFILNVILIVLVVLSHLLLITGVLILLSWLL